MAALQSISGARIMGNLSIVGTSNQAIIDPELLGHVDSVALDIIGGTKYIVVSSRPSDDRQHKKKISTFIVTAYSEYQCEILHHAYETV